MFYRDKILFEFKKKEFLKKFINKKIKILPLPKPTPILTHKVEGKVKSKYYIVSSGTYFITKKQLECCLKSVNIIIKKSRRHIINKLNFNVPITKKPRFSRMGSGKGRIRQYVSKIHMNSVIFIFNNIIYSKMFKIFKELQSHLPIKIYLKNALL